MTVTNKTNKVTELGNDVKVAYTFGFKVTNEADLEVYKVNTTTLVATLQTITTNYTVSLNTVTEGGTVTYVVAPTSTENSFIKRVMDFDQQTDVPTEGNIPEDSLNNEFDKGCMLDIQLEEELGRALKFATTSELTSIILPEGTSASNRALNYIRWDTAGTALELSTSSSSTLDTGTVEYDGRSITVDTGGGLDVGLGTAAGDDFTVDTTTLVVEGDTGNVGIGTATPSCSLDVGGVTGTSATILAYGALAVGGVGRGVLYAEGSINARMVLDDSGGTTDEQLFEVITFGSTTKLRAVNDDASVAYTFLTGDHSNGYVGIGIGAISPSGQLHVDQTSTTAAVPVLFLDQADISEEFIDFTGTATAGTTTSLSTYNTSATPTHHILCSVNGLKGWIPFSTNPPTA
ncbi:MAG: hypothetical protein GY928_27830 [Colwellia sp.]|nr:hypothetical protein [Colwellia sp.]